MNDRGVVTLECLQRAINEIGRPDGREYLSKIIQGLHLRSVLEPFVKCRAYTFGDIDLTLDSAKLRIGDKITRVFWKESTNNRGAVLVTDIKTARAIACLCVYGMPYS